MEMGGIHETSSKTYIEVRNHTEEEGATGGLPVENRRRR